MPETFRPKMMVEVRLPEWCQTFYDAAVSYSDDYERMGLVITLARRNILDGGGPFAAAVFEAESGRIAGLGVNRVVAAGNSTLHAELMAIMMAEGAVKSHTLADLGRFELFSSCAPCAMCLGGLLWSGIGRLVSAAEGEDAREIGFDEGPVFEESYSYLEQRGVQIRRRFMREEGKAVLQSYLDRGGRIYNGLQTA